MNNFKVITENIIKRILEENYESTYDIIKKLYVLHEKGKTVIPPSYFLRFDKKSKKRIIALPAAFKENNYKAVGIKWIASNPKNIDCGMRRASATIILNDYVTGFPLACLEGSRISAFRTACSAIIGADAIISSRASFKRLGIVGAGPISQSILNCFLKKKWSFDKILVHDLNTQRQQYFRKIFSDYHINEEHDLNSLIKHTDIIVLATSALEPYINEIPAGYGQKIILHISLRDICPQIISQNQNIVDDVEHVLRENTSVHLAYQLTQNKSFLTATIGKLLCDSTRQQFDDNHIIYSPMGLGVLDIAIANFVYRYALEKDYGITIDNFMDEN